MIQVANPIYDIVFKYMMEDERIAKILISAFLKKEVLDIEQRRNEYTNGTRENLSIPRLTGQLNNRLETVLNVFDQARKDSNPQTITVDESLYMDNDDMLYILHRLREASSDTKLRHDMNVEDEYFSAIEKRDTEILMRDKMLAEQKTQLDEQKTQLDEQRRQIVTSVKMLLMAGMPVDVISKNLNVTPDFIESCR